MADFVVKGISFRSLPMDTFAQLHIASRLMPIMASLKESFKLGEIDTLAALESAAISISKMTDADREYIVKGCLNVTQRKQGDMYVQLMAGGRMMFEDIDLSIMMLITTNVLLEKFGPFFLGPSAQNSPAAVSQ